MSHQAEFAAAIAQAGSGAVLQKGSGNKEAVKALQTLLHELGFDRELNWARWGADGSYGSGTARAVAAFYERNALAGDGTELSVESAGAMLSRFDVVDDLRHLYNAVEGDKTEQLMFRGSPERVAVSALQTLLNALGFGEQLKWAEFGADGDYGSATARAVQAFATSKGLVSDGELLRQSIGQAILDELSPHYGAAWMQETQPTHSRAARLRIRETVESGKTRIYVSDGTAEVRFTKFRKGIYTFGKRKAIDFINANRETLAAVGLNRSAVNVMIGVSENEGNLDAVNTWDNSFMTFGMFQWTIGTGKGEGELPALINKIKDGDAAVFNTFFGQYGIDVVDTGAITGYFSLNGEKLDSAAAKESLRTNEWAYYFWKAGQNPTIQSAQVRHAFSRIGSFYRSDNYKVKGSYIADLITCEYGVGLLLDNHVNRPGYVKGTLEEALERSGLPAPQRWGSDEERQLIEVYLQVRQRYGRSPMTNAAKRAAVTKKYLDRGIISDERGSFEWREQ